MAYFFADSFDLYATPADAALGYWDSITASWGLGAGRFAGSQALTIATTGQSVVKSSGLNEAVHHFVVSFQQTAAITGSSIGLYIALFDGATAQCSVIFRSDGTILLAQGGANGTTIATYSGAFPAASTWYAFEIEVVVNNTTGSIAIRKNGNTVNDFFLGSLNTRGGTANNYANKVSIGMLAAVNTHFLDDFIWRSDPSAVAWIGDVRAYVRRPATDASVQWTPSGSAVPVTPSVQNTTASLTANQSVYTQFTPQFSGTIGSVTLPVTTASTANFKCAIYASAGGIPTTSLGAATPVAAPALGTMTFTFPTPPSVTAGTLYFVAMIADAASGQIGANSATTALFKNGDTYSTFPNANPVTSAGSTVRAFTVNVTPTGVVNAPFVADLQEDGAASYVFSSTVGQSDLYGLSTLSATPATIVATVTRAFVQKSDAGTRNVSVQLKSGATTVQGASTALNTTFGWLTRVDSVDPATGAAWTAVGVNNATIGAVVTA